MKYVAIMEVTFPAAGEFYVRPHVTIQREAHELLSLSAERVVKPNSN
jgi:hypothetical protein